MKYLVDANILSEPTRPEPNTRVVRWLIEHENDLAVNPIVLGELEYGIRKLPPGRRRKRLEQWFSKGPHTIVCLDIDKKTGAAWAELLDRLKRNGTPMPIKDSLIAVTALVHNLTLVTRNTKDFANTAVDLLNPFTR